MFEVVAILTAFQSPKLARLVRLLTRMRELACGRGLGRLHLQELFLSAVVEFRAPHVVAYRSASPKQPVGYIFIH